MTQTFCMIRHGITPLKTGILQKQTTTEKNKLIRYLILDKIKFFNLKIEILIKRAQKVKKTYQFYMS